jgi:hypothetical protein
LIGGKEVFFNVLKCVPADYSTNSKNNWDKKYLSEVAALWVPEERQAVSREKSNHRLA